MKIIMYLRPLKYSFYLNWYATRKAEYENFVAYLLDIGFITIGIRVKQKGNYAHFN